ncbi:MULTISPECIES: TetR/AcrR family transcriptional regulator [unclassified Streptomyces]|uniref:TetR/AcrR family transcriptional regulator n=1 Tax=unclassified Streptomyces TaxID=2593676 RepID=UPI003807AF68
MAQQGAMDDRSDHHRRTRAPQVDLDDSEILQRGLEAFAELGYSGASVRELAKRMGVNHNFINDRFGSKEKFWRAALDHALRAPIQQLITILDGDLEDVEKFTCAVRTFHSLAANMPHANRIISDESVFASDRLNYLYSEYTGRFMAKLEPLAQRLMTSGRMPAMSMDVLFSALTGPAVVMTQRQLVHRMNEAGDSSTDEWRQKTAALAEVVLRGLLT